LILKFHISAIKLGK